MVGIPLFGEQRDNIAHMSQRSSWWFGIQYYLISIVFSFTYKENAMWLSTIHNDQPIKPLDRAIFWIEFVVHHKGAKHLNSLSFNLTWCQYHSLD
ncbi:hypothetical protein A6R68_11918, partial [Neotoma lepida]